MGYGVSGLTGWSNCLVTVIKVVSHGFLFASNFQLYSFVSSIECREITDEIFDTGFAPRFDACFTVFIVFKYV